MSRASTIRTAPADPATLGWAVVVERALRAVLIIAAALILARAWGINLGDIAMGETGLTRAVRACLRIVIVLLAADVIWKLIRTLIDSRITPVAAHGEEHVFDDSPEAKRRQRLNTLLPILRNFLMVMIIGVAVLMALDALGVQIGPLLAGAGVVGIAIGFGAQTLVKDIISGIFYLLDDAFRVGEYIQTSSYKGTVESFSLRSVKLRHHRGPITTVPFGELGAVQNQSRDWVIDKMTIGVTYDTDLDKVRKIIKEIGRELAGGPGDRPNIIEPLKMQGVEQMGEFAIQIRLKMMTKPGEQFVVRRKAYAAIKKAFEANGIKFAVPTVQVSGGGQDGAAASLYERMAADKAAAEAAEGGGLRPRQGSMSARPGGKDGLSRVTPAPMAPTASPNERHSATRTTMQDMRERYQEIEQAEHDQRRQDLDLGHVRHRLDEDVLEHADAAGRVGDKAGAEGGEEHAEHDEIAGIARFGQRKIDDRRGADDLERRSEKLAERDFRLGIGDVEAADASAAGNA